MSAHGEVLVRLEPGETQLLPPDVTVLPSAASDSPIVVGVVVAMVLLSIVGLVLLCLAI